MPMRIRLASKLPWLFCNEVFANAAQFFAMPAQPAVELDPLPRLACRYSADSDHDPYKPISAPPPATQPREAKLFPPLNEAMLTADDSPAYVSRSLCAPPAINPPAFRYGYHCFPAYPTRPVNMPTTSGL